MRKPLSVLLALAILLLFVSLGWWGGAKQALDVEAILRFQAWRSAHPAATGWVILLTHAGGAPFLLAVAGIAAAALLWRKERRRALLLVLTVLGGRLGVELIKLLVDRPRPSFDAHPVMVFSQSFPSGHAANSMVTYLALALFALPARWRAAGVAAALSIALAIGATRPMLGVHWPSDVLGGWLYGLLVVGLAWRLSLPPRSGA